MKINIERTNKLGVIISSELFCTINPFVNSDPYTGRRCKGHVYLYRSRTMQRYACTSKFIWNDTRAEGCHNERNIK